MCLSVTGELPLLGGKALYEGVADSIRERIFRHELPPGSPLDEIEQARHYGVSRTPVREAIKVLASEGLIDIRPYRGCRVASLAREDLVAALDVVDLLVVHALRRLLAVADRSPLQGLCGELAAVPAWPACWPDFCVRLCRLSGSPPLAVLARNLQQQLRLGLGPALSGLAGVPPEGIGDLRRAVAAADETAALAAATGLAAGFRQFLSAVFRTPVPDPAISADCSAA